MNVFAHRGFSGCYPENTMLAFQKAAETGCHGIELDVQRTRDGVPAIIHDETVDRVTEGTGFVRDYTWDDLRRLNAAHRWGGKFGSQPIPSFREYCEWAKGQSLITNVELKNGVYYYQELEEDVVALVREYGLSDRVIFSSFNHSSLLRVQALAPDIPTGALVEHEGLGNAGYYCAKYGFTFYHPGCQGLTAEEVRRCRDQGIPINVWTVNDMETLKRMEAWQVHGVITNYPDVCLAYLRAKDALS